MTLKEIQNRKSGAPGGKREKKAKKWAMVRKPKGKKNCGKGKKEVSRP